MEQRIRTLQHETELARAREESEAARAAAAEQRIDQLAAEIDELERRCGAPGYARLGEQMQRLLSVADEAAAELRTRCWEEAAEQRRQAEREATLLMAEAQREADRVLTRARQTADATIGTAERRLIDLRADLARVERQRDTLLEALAALQERLGEVAAGESAPPTPADGPAVVSIASKSTRADSDTAGDRVLASAAPAER